MIYPPAHQLLPASRVMKTRIAGCSKRVRTEARKSQG
jgi:hypothetical protein